MCAKMKKQTPVTILALALLLLAVVAVRLVGEGVAYAKPALTGVSVSSDYSPPPSPEDMCKALHEAFQASKPSLLQQMGICPPEVAVLSIAENQTFTISNITLSFTVTAPVKIAGFAYSLNGQENTTIEGNTTLTELSVGPQTIVVYAADIFGRSGASETVNFTIAQQEEPEFGAVVASQAAEPFSSANLVGVVAGCAVLGATIFTVYRRRKKKRLT
jgi:hypothetical protein